MRSVNSPKRDRGEMLRVLEEEKAESLPPNMAVFTEQPGDADGVLWVNTAAVNRAVAIFQARDLIGNQVREKALLRELYQTIKQGHDLDPAVIWWSGKRWYICDGHHRHQAYEKANAERRSWNQKNPGRQPLAPLLMPVKIVKGSLFEATAWATLENGKAVLPLTQKEKYDNAWRRTVMGLSGIVEVPRSLFKGSHVNKSEWANQLRITRQTLSKMWEAWGKHAAKHGFDQMYPEEQREFALEACDYTWKQAMAFLEDKDPDKTDFDKEAEIASIVDRLRKQFGPSFLHHKGALFAEALMRIDRQAPERAMECDDWADAMVRLVDLAHGEHFEDDEADIVDF